MNGVDEPVYSYGELVGVRKKVNDRLLMFMLRNRSPDRFAHGANGKSSSLKGLNAVGKMEKRRHKKKWRKQWEEEQRSTSPAQLHASINAKVEGIRRQVEIDRQREWEQLSEETREAWERFEQLRDADFERLRADEATRLRLERGPSETVNAVPHAKKKPPAPKPPKMVHGLKDDGWE